MNKIKCLILISLILFTYAAKSNAATMWLQAYRVDSNAKSYGFPYPQPMVERDETAASAFAASVQIATATCARIVNELDPDGCLLEVAGGVTGLAYCRWKTSCTSTTRQAYFKFHYGSCADGTYPDPGSIDITCQTTEPQYCPDGEVYNNVAGTCDIPPPPPPPPPEKNFGNPPDCPSPFVASDTK